MHWPCLNPTAMRALLSVIILAAAAFSFAQGTVNFANGAAGVNAPITNIMTGLGVAGPGFQAQLYVGPAGTVNPALLTTNGVSGTSAPFSTGGAAGYFFGGARTIAGASEGTIVTMQVRVWMTSWGASWETAICFRGESNLIQVSLGGLSPTPNMVGLQGFTAGPLTPCPPVQEPSSIALTMLGTLALGLFGVRRRAPRS